MTSPSQPTGTTSTEALAEDFLYHLFRGNQLLAEGSYEHARDELERALKMQPRDAAAQDLLAKLYFRLGVYPRAIGLYLEIVRQFPDRVAPRINLALAFLKTGQMRDAVSQLLPVIEREPDHARAWGYLGLAWSRLNEFAKAREAFHRAGHEGMARKMEQMLLETHASGAQPSLQPASLSVLPPPPRPPTGIPGAPPLDVDDIDSSALESGDITLASSSNDASPGAWSLREPGHAPSPSLASVTAGLPGFAARTAVTAAHGVLDLVDGLLVAEAPALVRPDARCIQQGTRWDTGAMPSEAHAPQGVPTRLLAGRVIVPPRADRARTVIDLHDEPIAVRAAFLLAFDGRLTYDRAVSDSAGTSTAITNLRGRGRVVLEHPGALRSLRLGYDAPLQIPLEMLVFWSEGIALSVSMLAHGWSAVLRGEGLVAFAPSATAVSVERIDG